MEAICKVEGTDERGVCVVPSQCDDAFFCSGTAIDEDRDGCFDACIYPCEEASLHCARGQVILQATRNCSATCEPTVCETAPDCPVGETLGDSDGDGCNDTCRVVECTENVLCEVGSVALDSDFDGCSDVCRLERCTGEVVTCREGFVPVDREDDGCFETCQRDPLCGPLPECSGTDREVDSCDNIEGDCGFVENCDVIIFCVDDAP